MVLLPLFLATVDLSLWDGYHGAEKVVHLLEWRTTGDVNGRVGGFHCLEPIITRGGSYSLPNLGSPECDSSDRILLHVPT